MLFRRGKAMSGAPIMIGTNQLPKPPISTGMTTKKIMVSPEHRHGDGHEPREEREDDVEGADVLVVGGKEPARHEARRVVVVARVRGGGAPRRRSRACCRLV